MEETPGSETKDFIAHSTSSSMVFTFRFLLGSPGGTERWIQVDTAHSKFAPQLRKLRLRKPRSYVRRLRANLPTLGLKRRDYYTGQQTTALCPGGRCYLNFQGFYYQNILEKII